MTGARTLPAVTPARAREIVARFGDATVLVAGDVMLDRFLVGRVDRISPEAPVPVLAFEREEWRLGGAGNVAHNIAALGGRVRLAGTVGVDEAAQRLAGALAAIGIAADGLVADGERRTTTKVRLVTTRNQQVARIDYETDVDVIGTTETRLVDRASGLAAGAGAIIVSDYLKGAVTRRLVSELAAIARSQAIPLLVDPKVPHLDSYVGSTLVTPNHHEAEIATHRRIRSDEDACEAARALRARVGCEAVLITRGEHGMWLLDGGFEGPLAATAREVADVTGAGDTVVATLALALAAGATPAEAASLANRAAGVVVGKFGPATLSAAELIEACGEQGRGDSLARSG